MSLIYNALFGSTKDNKNDESNVKDPPLELIEKLNARIEQSKLIDDKLLSLSRLQITATSFPFEVATASLEVLANEIRSSDHDDCILQCLNVLLTIFKSSVTNGEPHMDCSLLAQFTEIFVSKQANIDALISALENPEFKVRFASLRLLTDLVAQSPETSIRALTHNPVSINVIVNLLSAEDSIEIIRYDALNLVRILTKNPFGQRSHLCRLVAFQNGFDRLIAVAKQEGGIMLGGAIVEDCLDIMHNLLSSNCYTLKNNDSSIRQLFFHSVPINDLANLFDNELPNAGQQQMFRNIVAFLKVLNVLVCRKCIECGGIDDGDDHLWTKSQECILQSCIPAKLIEVFNADTCSRWLIRNASWHGNQSICYK